MEAISGRETIQEIATDHANLLILSLASWSISLVSSSTLFAALTTNPQ